MNKHEVFGALVQPEDLANLVYCEKVELSNTTDDAKRPETTQYRKTQKTGTF